MLAGLAMKAKRKVAKKQKLPWPKLPFIVDNGAKRGSNGSKRHFWTVPKVTGLEASYLGTAYAKDYMAFQRARAVKSLGHQMLPLIVSDMPRPLGQIAISFLWEISRDATR